jgi:hypothetical protein
MSYKYGPSIVTDGLVFYADAANENSYPGTGTTWTDLIGGAEGTLTNGPTYSSDNGGLILTDGVDDYIDFNSDASVVPLSEGTIEIFFRSALNTASFETILMVKNDGANQIRFFGRQGTSIRMSYEGGNVQKNISIPIANFSSSSFAMLTLTYSNSSDEIKGYLDGVQYGSTLNSVTAFSGTPGTFRLGANEGGNNPEDLDISSLKIYNRALSSTEILQNYNALKNRFV